MLETLQTERLLLRPFETSDLPALTAIHRDPQTMKHIGGPRSAAKSRQELQHIIAGYEILGFGPLALVRRQKCSDEEQVIGRCGLWLQQIEGRREFDLAYLVARDHWNQGYATEAATAVRDWAFEYGFPRLICLIERDNTPSLRVAEKLEFAYIRDVVHEGRPVQMWSAEASLNRAKELP